MIYIDNKHCKINTVGLILADQFCNIGVGGNGIIPPLIHVLTSKSYEEITNSRIQLTDLRYLSTQIEIQTESFEPKFPHRIHSGQLL